MSATDWITLLALGSTILGWTVVYKLTLRSQRDQLQLNLVNEARVATYTALKDYQEWCGALVVQAQAAEGKLELCSSPLKVVAPWQALLQEMPKLAFEDPRGIAWMKRLEEYELLLPFTVGCRIQIYERHRSVERALSDHVLDLRVDPKRACQSLKADVAGLWDMIALAHDLGIHVQNRCLGTLTGTKLLPRMVLGMTGPRLIDDGAGGLRIVDRA